MCTCRATELCSEKTPSGVQLCSVYKHWGRFRRISTMVSSLKRRRLTNKYPTHSQHTPHLPTIQTNEIIPLALKMNNCNTPSGGLNVNKAAGPASGGWNCEDKRIKTAPCEYTNFFNAKITVLHFSNEVIIFYGRISILL